MEKKKERLFNIYFFIIIFVNLTVSAMMQMFNSTIALHMNELDYGASVSGTIISIGAISASIYRFFGGKLCERSGRKKLIMAGIGCFGIMSVLLGSTSNMPLIYIFRIFQMFGYSMASTAVSIAVIDVIPKSRVGEGLGYYSLATFLPQACGPSIALFLFQMKGGFFSVMAGAGAIGAISLAITCLFLNYEKRMREQTPDMEMPLQNNKISSEQGVWKYIEKKALPASVINFFIMFVGTLVTMYLTLYATQSGIANPGLFFTFSAIAMVAARIVSGKLYDSIGVLAAVVPGILMLIGGFILLVFCSRIPWGYYAAGILYGLGTGMSEPALNAQAVRGVRKERTSIATSTFFLPVDIAFMAGSVLWGMMIDHLSFSFIFSIAALISGIALMFSLVVFALQRPQNAGRTLEI